MAPYPVITSRAQLRQLYPAPSRPAVAKQIDHLDGHCRALIAHSPFLVMATAGADGKCDSSPRGGPAGFVRVLDDHRLGIPDLAGNNRLDSLENILDHPGVGLLFFVPGLDETLRVNGAAQLRTDAAVLDVCTINDVRPRLVVTVRVEAAYIQCAKALRRGGLWQRERWPDTSGLPTIACMLRDHYALPDLDLAVVEERLAQSYQLTMWLAGGEAPPITGD
jgi:uncharacterized protein